MDSPKDWHPLFTGICSILAAVVGAAASYFLTERHASRQNDAEVASLKQRLASAQSSVPQPETTPFSDFSEKERSALRSRIAELQTNLATEKRAKEEAEQELQTLQSGSIAQKEKINNLQSKVSEIQSALDSLKTRYASVEQQLKKFSEDSQARLDRARTNYKAGRYQRFRAPDGSNRNFIVVYDETGVDTISPSLKARFDAGQ